MIRIYKIFKDLSRLFQLSLEFMKGFHAFRNEENVVTVFGSARMPESSPHYPKARELAKAMGAAGFTILTGGGLSLMEAANRGAKDAGSRSLAVNVVLPFEQKPNGFIDRVLTMKYFFTRKYMLISYSVGFIFLPGGFGTLDEFFETLTLMQTGKIPKRPVFLFGTEYWAGLQKWVNDTLVAQKALGEKEIALYRITDNIGEIVEALERSKNKVEEQGKAHPVNPESKKARAPDPAK